MLRSTTPRKVNFADDVDSKSCTSCSALFTIVCLKHACKKCNKNYCGKCSKSNVATISNTLVRERLCNGCSEQRSAVKSLFTPSKLNLLDEYGNAASKLWSADSESDCDSDDDSTPKNTSIVVGYRLSADITDQENNELVNMPAVSTPQQKTRSAVKLAIAVAGSTPAQDKLIRTLCDASFSDSLSAASSVSSKAASSARKSPGSAGGAGGGDVACTACRVAFSSMVRRHMCSHCTKMVCGDCSATELLIRNESVLRHRVCSACQPALTDAPFTPGKLHLLGQPVGTGSATSGRRRLQNRLWSADTETDSDCSSQDDWRDEVDGSVASLAENLLYAIDEEETRPIAADLTEDQREDTEVVEEVREYDEESDTSVFENWEVSWAPDFPEEALGDSHQYAIPVVKLQEEVQVSEQKYPRAKYCAMFVVLVVLYMIIFSALYGPVRSVVLSLERRAPVPHCIPILPSLVLPTASPLDTEHLEELQVAEVGVENAQENKYAAVPPVNEVRRRPEMKVTMLLLAPPALPTTRLSAQSRRSKLSRRVETAGTDAKAVTSGGMSALQTKVRAMLRRCWHGVSSWLQRTRSTSTEFISRLLPQRRTKKV